MPKIKLRKKSYIKWAWKDWYKVGFSQLSGIDSYSDKKYNRKVKVRITISEIN